MVRPVVAAAILLASPIAHAQTPDDVRVTQSRATVQRGLNVVELTIHNDTVFRVGGIIVECRFRFSNGIGEYSVVRGPISGGAGNQALSSSIPPNFRVTFSGLEFGLSDQRLDPLARDRTNYGLIGCRVVEVQQQPSYRLE